MTAHKSEMESILHQSDPAEVSADCTLAEGTPNFTEIANLPPPPDELYDETEDEQQEAAYDVTSTASPTHHVSVSSLQHTPADAGDDVTVASSTPVAKQSASTAIGVTTPTTSSNADTDVIAVKEPNGYDATERLQSDDSVKCDAAETSNTENQIQDQSTSNVQQNMTTAAQATSDADAQAASDADAQATSDADAQAASDVDAQATSDANVQATSDADAQATSDADAQATNNIDAHAAIQKAYSINYEEGFC